MEKEGKLKEVEQLISMDGDKEFLPFDEGNDIPSHDIVSSDQLDDVLMMFDEMDIDVMDDLQGLKVEEEKLLDKEEREGEEIEIGAFSRASDPVRMYLREMGSVSLLTREGEVEIAKRIEEGERDVASVILNTPITVKEVISLGERLKKFHITAAEISKEVEEEELEE